MIIEVYSPYRQAAWDSFVTNSKNGTFLFYRNYMDYHSDRFADHSLIVWDDSGHIIALLPANKADNRLESHGGLTYGGFVTNHKMTAPKMLEVFEVVCRYARDAGFAKWIYKPVPHIYHDVPAEEDLYALYRMGARVYKRDVLTVIDYRQRIQYQERRERTIRRAIYQSGVHANWSFDYKTFWNILADNLQTRYNLHPVHSVEEIELLAGRFPSEIKLHCAGKDGVMLAGAVVYLSRHVCHVQYNAASTEGKLLGALDVILDKLIGQHQFMRYLDFGVSTENNGHYLNVGLVDYKEGFGGRTVVHDLYEMDL